MNAANPSGDDPVDPLRPELVLTSSTGRPFRLVGYLGSGRTGEVWAGTPVDDPGRTLAVKIRAAGLGELLTRQFFSEVETLGELARVQANLELRLGDSCLTPTVLAESRQEPWPFFVHTLATGRPLDELLREGVALAEADVLTIGEQLCRVLQALHEGLARSYLDFQPRNVFWDGESRRIMVIDWNLLSPQGQADVAADLEAAARLVYRLAVGEPAQVGQLDRADGWRSLTSGARALLAQALHANPALRYQSAAEMRRAAAQLLGWWGQTSDELLWQVAGYLDQLPQLPEREDQEQLYRTAQHVLDIAGRKGIEDRQLEDKLGDAIRAGLAHTGPLSQTRALFEAGDYQSASRSLAELGPEPATLPEQLEIERWRVAVENALEYQGRLSAEVQQQILDCLGALNEWSRREWEGVRPPTFEEASRWVDAPASLELARAGLPTLVMEAYGWAEWLRARERRGDDAAAWDERLQAYSKALQHAQALPYLDRLATLWGDIRKAAAGAEEQLRQLKARQSLLDNVSASFRLHHGQPQLALEELRRAFAQLPQDPQLTQLAIEWSSSLLTRGRWQDAGRSLAEVALAGDRRRLDELVELQARLDECQRAEHLAGWAEVELDQLARIGWDFVDSLASSALPAQLAEVVVRALAASRAAAGQNQAAAIGRAIEQHLHKVAADQRWRRYQAVLSELAEVAARTGYPALRQQVDSLVQRTLQAVQLPPWQAAETKAIALKLTPGRDEAEQLLADLNRQVAAGLRERDQLAQQLAASQAQVADLNRTAAARQQLVDELTQRLDADQQRAAQLMERLAASQNQAEELTQRVAAGQQQVTDLNRRLAASQQEATDLRQRLAASAVRPMEPAGAVRPPELAVLPAVPPPPPSIASPGAPAPVGVTAAAPGEAAPVAQPPRPTLVSHPAERRRPAAPNLGTRINLVKLAVETCFTRVPPPFHEVLEQLDEVIEATRQAEGREASRTDLEGRRKLLADAEAAYQEYLENYANHLWKEAVQDLSKLRDVYGLNGIHRPGDLTKWWWVVSAEQAMADFVRHEQEWKTAGSAARQLELLAFLLESLKPISPDGSLPDNLRQYFEAEQWTRLEAISERLAGYRRQLGADHAEPPNPPAPPGPFPAQPVTKTASPRPPLRPTRPVASGAPRKP